MLHRLGMTFIYLGAASMALTMDASLGRVPGSKQARDLAYFTKQNLSKFHSMSPARALQKTAGKTGSGIFFVVTCDGVL